jgi:hypothetical protein
MLAKMRGRTAVLLVILGGCAARRPTAVAPTRPLPDGVVHGSRADMTTRPGAFDGYVVDDRCRQPDCFAVRGTGATWFEGDKPLVGFDDMTTRERWRAMIAGAMAFTAVGALLAHGGFRDEVALCMRAPIFAVEHHR